MKYDFIDAINEINRSIRLSQEFTKGMSFKDFQSDEKTLYAVIRCIEVIGEAVKRLPDSFRDSYPEIPWKAMACTIIVTGPEL